MNLWEMTLLIWLGSFLAGFLGALTGLGGGVVIIPWLTLGFGVDIRYAIGTALVSVIATSSGAAAAYVKEGFSNLRIGMLLEMATTAGALLGATAAAFLSANLVAILFGVVLLLSVITSLENPREHPQDTSPDALAARLRLSGSYPGVDGTVTYGARHVPAGFALMILAGALSGLLGIGSGAFKVLALDRVMRIPYKVSTATSNFMIGVTAATSAGVYLNRGFVDPGLAMPVVLGVLPGAMLGTHFLSRTRTRYLRVVFTAVIFVLALEMLVNGYLGKF
jgi:uncharacterized membrane protein YfcA